MQQGDFVRIDFIGKVVGTGQVFDFTQEEVAKKEKMHDEKRKYEPALVIIGAHMVIPGVEKQLMRMKLGEERRFTVSPDDAFGPRNPKLIKIFSMTSFLKQKINPAPGNFVQIEGLQGKVQSVSGGRVRVDFNHPLAGKELEYWIKIVEVINSPDGKINALFSHYQIPYEKHFKDTVLTITGKVKEDEQQPIQEIVTRWIKEVKDIKFSEKS